jgi:YVTN family beta-propeller protein
MRKVLALVVTALGVVACTPNAELSAVSSGTLALSADSANLYVLEADQNKVYVFDANSYTQLATVAVGKNPARIVVASDETIYVSNRGERTVSVITRNGSSWTEAARIPVGVEPVGLAVTKDAKTLLVVNSTMLTDLTTGSLMAIDTASRSVIWETPVGHEPRAVGILSGDKALVPLYFDGTADLVDIKTGNITRQSDPLHNNDTIDSEVAAGTTAGLTASTSGYLPTGLSDVAVTADGTRAFIPGQWARVAPIQRPPSSGGYYSLGGPCSYGAVVAPGLLTYDAAAWSAHDTLDDLSSCSGPNAQVVANYPPTAIPPDLVVGSATAVASSVATDPGKEVSGPVAAVVDSTGKYVYVANQQSGNVLVMTAYGQDQQPVNLGAGVVAYADLNTGDLTQGEGGTPGPSGLALHKDGRRLFVHNAFDHDFVVLGCDNCTSTGTMTILQTIPYTTPTLPPEAEQGRKLFFTANNADITATGSPVACASCHLEGRTDGHPWGFPEGLSTTPVLVGRNFTQTQPWDWSGSFTDLGLVGIDQTSFFSDVITQRMGGSDQVGATVHNEIATWLSQYAPVQDNPFRYDASGNVLPLSASAQRGQALFNQVDISAGLNNGRSCATCHNPSTNFALSYTVADSTIRDVGTDGSAGNAAYGNDPTGYTVEGQKLTPDPTLNSDVTGFDVPSLLSIGRSGPYMHDARYLTLDQRLHDGNTTHGNPGRFTESQKQDLEAYLLTL